MTPVVVTGWFAAVVGTVTGWPQLFRLARTRRVDGLSLTAWQLILALNICWLVHGFQIRQLNMIVPNLLGLFTTVPILFLMSRSLQRGFARVVLPGALLGAALGVVDIVFGTTAFGIVALVPAVAANLGQSLELVRAPLVRGVSPLTLVGSVLNQVLWLAWGMMVPDAGTIIAATATGTVCGFNLLWWVLRRLGLRSFATTGLPAPVTVVPGESADGLSLRP